MMDYMYTHGLTNQQFDKNYSLIDIPKLLHVHMYDEYYLTPADIHIFFIESSKTHGL